MKAFNDQFKKASAIVKTAEMMDEEQYWKIVQKSLKNATDEEEQEESLVEQLEKLKPHDIVGFRLRTDKLLFDSYTSEMWCAGYILNGGCSDDGFEYFRCWVISRGKAVYDAALLNPDSLINQVVDEDFDEYEFELFWYVALEAFENKTGKEIYDYIDYGAFTTREARYPSIEINWNEDESETMKAICPQLFEKLCAHWEE